MDNGQACTSGQNSRKELPCLNLTTLLLIAVIDFDELMATTIYLSTLWQCARVARKCRQTI
jgi:hypothetical protein